MNTKIIIIGGLSAGPSAAAKARRENENAEITLFENSANISYSTCGISYALSGVIPSRDKKRLKLLKENTSMISLCLQLEQDQMYHQ